MPTYRLKQAILPLGAAPPSPSAIAAAVYPAPDLLCTFTHGAVDLGMPGWSYHQGNVERVMDTFLSAGANLQYFAPLSNYYLGAIGEFFGAFGWLAAQATPFRFQDVIRITRNMTIRANQPDFWIRDAAGNYTVLECKSTTDVAQVGLASAVCTQINTSVKGAYVQLPIDPATGTLVQATYRLRGQQQPVTFTPPANRAVAAVQYLRDAQLNLMNAAGNCPAGAQTCVPNCLAGREIIQLLLDSHAGQPQPPTTAIPPQVDAVFHYAYQATRMVQLGMDQGAGINFLQAAKSAEQLPREPRWEAAMALTTLLSERVSMGGGVERPIRGMLNRLLHDAPVAWRRYLNDHKRQWGQPMRTSYSRRVAWGKFWAASPHPEQLYLFDPVSGEGWFARQLAGEWGRHVRLVPDIRNPEHRDEAYERAKQQLLTSMGDVVGEGFMQASETVQLSFQQAEGQKLWETTLSEVWFDTPVVRGESKFSVSLRLDADGAAVILQHP